VSLSVLCGRGTDHAGHRDYRQGLGSVNKLQTMCPEPGTTRHYYVSLPLALLVGACFFTAFLALNPGLMSYDSLQTWRMSEDNAPLTNAHPVVYIVLLQALRWLW